MPFTPAVKEQFTLKLAIAGLPGAGKSYTSCLIAQALSNGERFAFLDCEKRKSRKYADLFAFDAQDLTTSFSLSNYTKAIKEAENAGYKVLIIDGLSQLWEGKGGVKELVDNIAKRDRISTFNAWQFGNSLLQDFVNVILASPMHIICTLRCKIDYAQEPGSNGKTQHKRVGLAPIQKDNLEYEFDLFAEINHLHELIFYKSLCTKLSGKVLAMSQEGEIKRLVAILSKWMEGAPPARQLASAAGASQPALNQDQHVGIVFHHEDGFHCALFIGA